MVFDVVSKCFKDSWVVAKENIGNTFEKDHAVRLSNAKEQAKDRFEKTDDGEVNKNAGIFGWEGLGWMRMTPTESKIETIHQSKASEWDTMSENDRKKHFDNHFPKDKKKGLTHESDEVKNYFVHKWTNGEKLGHVGLALLNNAQIAGSLLALFPALQELLCGSRKGDALSQIITLLAQVIGIPLLNNEKFGSGGQMAAQMLYMGGMQMVQQVLGTVLSPLNGKQQLAPAGYGYGGMREVAVA